MKIVWPLLLILFPFSAQGQAWQFSRPVTVAADSKGVFHHLGGSSRRAIAVGNETVAVVWEDNRDGTPRVYAAFKPIATAGFGPPIKISQHSPAFEPGITALSDGRFIIAWEENNRVWIRMVNATQQGDITAVSDQPTRQAALYTTLEDNTVAVWAQQVGQPFKIFYSTLQVDGMSVKVRQPHQVDSSDDKADQLYPSVYQSNTGTLIGWEDRRFGNTRIFTAFAPVGKAFSPYRLLNEFQQIASQRFGRGSGAMRISIAGDGRDLVVASWLDKRDFAGGYDVYAAVSLDGGKSFARNELAQDSFGENTPQWHNTLAISRKGEIMAAWDDSRDELPHIWLTERVAGAWGTDINVTAAGDRDRATHPVMCVDPQGRLHLAYIAQRPQGTAVMYLTGSR